MATSISRESKISQRGRQTTIRPIFLENYMKMKKFWPLPPRDPPMSMSNTDLIYCNYKNSLREISHNFIWFLVTPVLCCFGYIWRFIALHQITVVYGGRHFDRCSVSPEMFAWLHLINPVTVDWTGGSGTRSACCTIWQSGLSQTKDSLIPARGLGWKPSLRAGIRLSEVWD